MDLRARLITLRQENSKNKDPRFLPLTSRLLHLVQEQWNQRRDLSCPYVFTKNGHRIGDFRKVWRTATTAANKPGLIVHDLRRSAVKNLMQSRVAQKVAMQITGHKTVAVFQRYHIVDLTEMQSALEQTQRYIEDGAGETNLKAL